MKHYILDPDNPHQPKAVSSEEWLAWGAKTFGDQQVCRVDKTVIDPGCMVSTVFLGVNHSLSLRGPPMLFETLVFGGEHDGLMQRYATWDEAALGHKEVVATVMATV